MRRAWLAIILAAAFSITIRPGLGSDTGVLVIKTQEKGGVTLPGVTVEITNSRGLPVPRAQRTDDSGTATFLLSAGPGYTVKVSLPNFAAQTQDFELTLSRTKTILFQMGQQLTEKVTVKANIVELDEGGEQKVTFSDTFVEDLPILGRNYQNILTLAPGINDANNDGNPNVHGSRERDFKATVDGVSNVDPLTGTFMSNINPDAIEEIEIVTTGASAEYGGAVGGFGKIITKQGTNSFDGTSSIYVRSSVFDGNTVNTGTDSEPADYHDVRPTLNFTGPIARDRVFFALFHEYIDQGRPVNLVGGQGLVVVTKGSRNLDKLTWQLSPRNKLVFQTQSDPFRRGPLAVDALTDPRSGVDYKQGGPIYQIHWNTQVSSVLNIETLLGLSHTGISLIPITNGILNHCGIDEEGAVGTRLDPYGNIGGPRIDYDYCFETKNSHRSGSYLEKYSDDRVRFTIKSDASYFLPNFLGLDHTMKAGFLLEKRRFSNSDQLRPFSTFSEITSHFGGLDAPSQTGGGILSRQVYIPGLPSTVENKGEGAGYALYLEDQFRPRPNLSVRFGVRAEQEILAADGFKHFDPGQEDRDFHKNYTQCLEYNPENTVVCATSNFHYFHTYELFPVPGNSPIRSLIEDPRLGIQKRERERYRISNTNIAPRLSVSWDPGSDGKTKVFGTAGRYYGETFLAIPLFEQPPDNFLFTYQVDPVLHCVPDSNGDATVCGVRSVIQGDTFANVSPASIRQVDRDLRTPYQDEYTIGISREIFQETSITLTYIKRGYRDLFQDIDINHFPVDRGTDSSLGCIRNVSGALVPIDHRRDGIPDDCGGRVVVVPGPPPFNLPQTFEIPDGIPDLYIHSPFFNQVNRVGNFNRSDYKAYQLEIKRRLHRNWELEASYVWSKAVGNAEDYGLSLGDDPTTVQDEYGYLDYDQRHVVKVNARTQLPLWNIRLSSAFSWESGRPYSITQAELSRDQARPFGPFAVSYAQSRTTYPTDRRNDQRNEGYWSFDVGARKDFVVGKTNLEASLDVINMLNDDSLYISGVRNNHLVAGRRTGRQFQIGAKMTF